MESHPFDTDTMLFMDWRDDHLADLPDIKERNSKLPTFLYAMPFTKNKVGVGVGCSCKEQGRWSVGCEWSGVCVELSLPRTVDGVTSQADSRR